jgi:exodeoxyribonuclease V beta subunit
VLDSQENLFDTQEVAELERVLEAVLKPGQIELTLSSLATTILGGQAEALDALFNDQNKWEEVMIQFRQFRHLWEAFGFMRCFRQILSDFKVRQRLLAYKDGERRITNLLHIGEVLQQKSVQEHTGMAGLVKWLKYQRLAVVPRLDEHVIRLDRDTDAVKVVTMHKSKGLEYPVVFCPFAWTENDTTLADTQTFHDSDGRLILDVGSSEFDSHSEIAAKEALAENIRLLYVALTRAVNLCYLVWGTINKTETSSLAYLFHNRGSVEDFLQNNILKNIEHARFMDDLKRFEKASDGTIAVSVLPSHEGKSYLMYKEELPALKCLTFSGSIQKDWHIRSFSSLVLNRPFETPKDHDEIREIESPRTVDHEETLEGIFAFPKGARAGTFLHDILEHLDFTAPDYTELVSEKLAAYGFGQQAWTETICAMVHNVLNTQLAPGFITLSCVENKMRLNELEFYFPIHSISPARLGQIFKIHGGLGLPADFPERIGSLNFSPCRGFMKGFMDMVFCHNGQYYLVDWKSNFLGRTVLDYNQRALTQTMEAEVYILQYIIYTLALHEYLTLRLPGYSYDKHFGGVFYIFLRGVNPEYGHQYGIYHDKPELALIEALREELI